MANKFVVNAEKRDERGKNDARRLRVAGKIPAVVYGGGSENMSVAAPLAELAAILRSDTGVNTVFSLDIAGEGVHDVIFQDRQIDPIMGRLIHADLRRFAKGEKIEMLVPVHLTGHAEGLSEAGSVLSHALREVKVLCEPTKTPEFFEIDVTKLAAGHAIHVSSIKVEEGVEILEDPETVIASILIVSEASLEPQLEEGAEPVVAGEEPKPDAAE
ncbi:MAG: 50S ribosomal protein L25 [Acidobacteria bacterium]|nr:50S ribosomal protein L25 [Acidobacteriota bacterium]